MAYKSKELREQAGKVDTKLAELVSKAKNENRSLDENEQKSFEQLEQERDQLLTEARGFEQIESYESKCVQEKVKPEKQRKIINRDADATIALRGCLLRSDDEKYREAYARFGLNSHSNFPIYLRSDDGQFGGTIEGHGEELVPSILGPKILEYLTAFGGIQEISYVLPTPKIGRAHV